MRLFIGNEWNIWLFLTIFPFLISFVSNSVNLFLLQVKDTVEESIYRLNKSRNASSIISGNKKNQDLPILTLKDIESLFAVSPPATETAATTADSNDEQSGSLAHLPPSVAAAIAAERRLGQSTLWLLLPFLSFHVCLCLDQCLC